MDDWDFSSPPGSPSSLLPQSIRDVLESVRAECGVYDSGPFDSLDESPLITRLNRPYNAPISKPEFLAKDNQNPGQKKFDIDMNENIPRENRKRKITADQENPGQRTPQLEPPPPYSQFKVQEVPSHQTEATKNEKKDAEKHREPENKDVLIIDMENPVQTQLPLRRTSAEQPKLTSIPGHEPELVDPLKNTAGHSPAEDGSLGSFDVSNIFKMPILGGKEAVDIKVNHSTSALSDDPTNNDKDPRILRAQQDFSSLANMHETENVRIEAVKSNLVHSAVQKHHEVVTVDLENTAQTQQNSLGIQPENSKLTGIPWCTRAKDERWIKIGDPAKVKTSSSPTYENHPSNSINYNRPVTRMADGNSHLEAIPKSKIYMMNPTSETDDVANIVEERIRTTRNVLQKEENQDQSKYGRFTKQLREHEGAEYVDLTDIPKSPKSVAGMNITMDEETTGVQDSCYEPRTSVGEQPKEKSAQFDASQGTSLDGSVISIEADELDGVCYTGDSESKEIPNKKEGSDEYKSGYEATTDFGDIDLPDEESKNIKLEYFSDDEIQPNEVKIESGKEKLEEHSGTNPLSIWKQELLSSDFNLMYGSLRAVLMTTISKNDRNRLIQTMNATMSEIEQVIMHGRNPTEQSVRCASPEVNDSDDEKSKSDSSEKEEKPKISVEDEKAFGKRKRMIKEESGLTLRERELILNQKRLQLLMKKNADGSWTCLVCGMVREVAFNGVCRACLAFTYRIERAYTIGFPLPTCDHANYSGGVKCKSCRFRKFSFMSMTAADARVREFSEKTCSVCEERSYSFRNAWQCSRCFYFFKKLNQRKIGVPYCKHRGEFPKKCDGCRCYKLQVGWHKYESRPYPLPVVKKNLFYEQIKQTEQRQAKRSESVAKRAAPVKK